MGPLSYHEGHVATQWLLVLVRQPGLCFVLKCSSPAPDPVQSKTSASLMVRCLNFRTMFQTFTVAFDEIRFECIRIE